LEDVCIFWSIEVTVAEVEIPIKCEVIYEDDEGCDATEAVEVRCRM
jgi:hypothetical protein